MRRLSAVALVLCSGCVITDKKNVDDFIDTPPSVRSPENAPDNRSMDQIIQEVFDVNGEIELTVTVRDENVGQDLEYLVWLDFRPEGAGPGTSTGNEFVGGLLPSVGAAERELTVSIPHSALGSETRCHKIEILVTGGFAPGQADDRDPDLEGDLGVGVFWVAMKNRAGDDPGMNSCP